MLGLLKVSVSAMLATVRCSDIYCDIPTWVPRCRCYVSVTVRGATATDETVSLQSADYANLGDLSARGGADRAVWRGTVCYILGNTWRVRDYLD